MAELKVALIDSGKVNPAVDAVQEGRRIRPVARDSVALLLSQRPETRPGDNGWAAIRYPIQVEATWYRLSDDLEGAGQKDLAERWVQGMHDRYGTPHGYLLKDDISRLLWTDFRVVTLDQSPGDLSNLIAVVEIGYWIAQGALA